jgi:hypothetical protein
MKLISKLSDRERLLFYFSVAGVIIFLVYNFIFSVLNAQIEEMDVTITGLRADLQEFAQVMQSKEKINKEFDIYAKYREKDEVGEVKLQGLVNTLAVQSELNVNELKPVVSKDPAKRNIELVAEGKITGLVNLLYSMQIVQSMLKVEKMDIAVKGPKTDAVKVSLVISKTTVE